MRKLPVRLILEIDGEIIYISKLDDVSSELMKDIKAIQGLDAYEELFNILVSEFYQNKLKSRFE